MNFETNCKYVQLLHFIQMQLLTIPRSSYCQGGHRTTSSKSISYDMPFALGVKQSQLNVFTLCRFASHPNLNNIFYYKHDANLT